MTLTDQDIERIAGAVARRMHHPSKPLSIDQAAQYLGVRASKENLASTFSRFSNPKKFKVPLKYTRVGKQKVFKVEDLEDFMMQRQRGG